MKIRWVVVFSIAAAIVVSLVAGCLGRTQSGQNSETRTGATLAPDIEQTRPGSNDPQMVSSPFRLCDLDHDGDCDNDDETTFKNSFDKCRGSTDYNFSADFDGDGCVVTADERTFYRELLGDATPRP